MEVFAQTPVERPSQRFGVGDKNCYYSHFRDLGRSSNLGNGSRAVGGRAVSKQGRNPVHTLLAAI